MCGRYHIDDNGIEEIRRIVKILEEKLKTQKGRDIYPSQEAPVILSNSQGELEAKALFWGFPSPAGKGLLINARAETALNRPLFSDSVRHRRCIIPARWFYEWTPQKEKTQFRREDFSLLYLAGLYRCFSEGIRFTILTTQANASTVSVHPRMPLILEEEEIWDWILDGAQTEAFLKKEPAPLILEQEYSQQSLVFS